MIRKLKAVDPELAERYNSRIDVVQEFVERAFHAYKGAVRQRERDAIEAAQREEERQRVLAEADLRRKREEEKARLAEEEAAQKQKAALLDMVKELAAKDPDALVEAGLRVVSSKVSARFPLTPGRQSTTYPAVAAGQCDSCQAKGVVCVGTAGKACRECLRLHYACSNNAGES